MSSEHVFPSSRAPSPPTLPYTLRATPKQPLQESLVEAPRCHRPPPTPRFTDGGVFSSRLEYGSNDITLEAGQDQDLCRSFHLTQLKRSSLHLEKCWVKQKIEEHEIALQVLKERMTDIEESIASTTSKVDRLHCFMDWMNDDDDDQHSNTRAGDSEVRPASTTTTAPTPTQARLLTNYYNHQPQSLQVINDADCNDAGTSDTDNSGHNKSYNGHNDLDDTTTKTTTTAVSHQLWTGINKSNRANTNDYDRRDHSNINSSNDLDDTTTTATTLATTTTRSITTT
ncbi:hypothetical protein EDB83DRAFT_2524835 [Lactarius deliciosus]|nr:hypothetical protein EDB83DRAFT_2524835 [Lactarius deliciosus]